MAERFGEIAGDRRLDPAFLKLHDAVVIQIVLSEVVVRRGVCRHVGTDTSVDKQGQLQSLVKVGRRDQQAVGVSAI